ncbi:MAG: dTDP-4-dehydrorhamnose reductase [Dictyoglomus sp.]|uniref:dTDP-4-dehydrorhamnose reductase n=1 Tax=Dictyoglomus sp. TaxID=28205 RepID=UPI003D0C9DC7
MKVLITGAGGFLGQYFVKEFQDHDVIPLTHKDINIEDKNTIEKIIELKPDLVIHPAAIRSPDICERDPDLAWKVNALGTKHIAIACSILDIPLIYISTDYVFSGDKNSPYTEFDTPNPINVYGRTKLQGELFVKEFCEKYFIIRTSYVFGEYGNNAFTQIYRSLKEGKEIYLSNYHFASCTYAGDLVRKVKELSFTKLYGTYHIVNKGIITRYDFAWKVAEIFNLPKDKIIKLTPENFNQPAPRPLYSVLRNYVLELYHMDDMEHYEEILKKISFLYF